MKTKPNSVQLAEKVIEIRLVCELSESEVADVKTVEVEGRVLRWAELSLAPVQWARLQEDAGVMYKLWCEEEKKRSGGI